MIWIFAARISPIVCFAAVLGEPANLPPFALCAAAEQSAACILSSRRLRFSMSSCVSHRSTSSPNDALSTKERKRDDEAAVGIETMRAADARAASMASGKRSLVVAPACIPDASRWRENFWKKLNDINTTETYV